MYLPLEVALNISSITGSGILEEAGTGYNSTCPDPSNGGIVP
jgi:hypothetical protein